MNAAETRYRLFPAPFTPEQANRAVEAWGANCGPGALAAIFNMTLDEVRPHLGDFESKGYTNPTLMFAALDSLGIAKWNCRMASKVLGPVGWPKHGLARIQWEGPWTRPGVPARVAYRHTHWVAARRYEPTDSMAIFDINAIGMGGWIAEKIWSDSLVPWLLKHCEPKADGKWHITHSLEIGLPPPAIKPKAPCATCDGEGEYECHHCHGDESINCGYCDGGNIKCIDCGGERTND